MRKFLVAVAAAAVVLSATGVAFAVNEYEVITGGSRGEGSPARPAPGLVRFGFRVSDTENLRPSPAKQFRIAAEGLKYYPKARPTCTFAQAEQTPVSRRCRRAIIGSGIARNHAGAVTNRSEKLICNLRVTLINITGPGISSRRGGMAIRLDGDQKVINDPNSREIGCIIGLHDALKGTMHNVRVGGRPSSELRFTVPDNLSNPAQGLENAVIESDTTVRRLTGRVRIRGRNRRVGVYSSIGCNGNQRLARVTFVSADGNRVVATDESNTC
jgi:hypothetical protein